MELKNKKINFLGDSITFGHSVDNKEDIFASLVTKELELAEGRNYGVNGTRFANQKDDSANPEFAETFRERAQRMEPDADVVIVFGGTNDFGHGDAPLGTWGDQTPWTFYGAASLLMKELIEKYPEARIIFMTPLHRTMEDSHHGSGSKIEESEPLIKYVQAIRQTAEYYAIPLIDLYAESGLQPNVPILLEKYMPDGLHPNEAGHRRLADIIISYLKNM